MKRNLFTIKTVMAAALLMTGTAAMAEQTASVTNPTVDTYVRKNNTTAQGSNTTIELQTYTNSDDDSKSTDFVGLMTFSFDAANSGHKISKATLRLTTERIKGDRDVNIYEFNGTVANDSKYADLSEAISTARSTEKIAQVKLEGQSGKSVASDKIDSEKYLKISAWQNEVDITDYVKGLSGTTFSIMIVRNADTNNSNKIFSADATDISANFNGTTTTVAASELKPLLTVEYEESSASSSSTGKSIADTWVRSSNTSWSQGGSQTQIEINGGSSNGFYGMMAFNIPDEVANYSDLVKVNSAILTLITKKATEKSSDNPIKVYGYGNDFEEGTKYETESSYITAATATNAIASFVPKATNTSKSLNDASQEADFYKYENWVNTIDLTSYVQSLGKKRMNLLFYPSSTNDKSIQFFSKEMTDISVTASDETSISIEASKLQPSLAVSYEVKGYDLTVTDAGAATLCLPFDATIPENVKAYTLSYTSGATSATATEVTGTITANTPVYIEASAGKYTFEATSGISATETPSNGSLTGTYADGTSVPEGSYILYKGESGVGFYKSNSSTVDKYHAYLTGSSSAKMISISIDGVSAIDNVEAQKVNDNNVYNLQGVNVNGKSLNKGLYIRNGKKFIVK